MSIVIDLAILAIVVLFAVRHYKLGLFCSLLTFGKFIAAIILASILRTPLALLGLDLIVGGGEYTPVQNAFAGIIAFVVIFAAVIAVSGFLIKKLSKIEIPIITRFDKLLGLALGVVIGIFIASLASTATFTVMEFISSAANKPQIMDVYNSSYVFKFIKEISLFEFVRSIF